MLGRWLRYSHHFAPAPVAAPRLDALLQSAENGTQLNFSPGKCLLGLDEVRGLRGGSVLDASSIRNILTGLCKPESPGIIDPRGIHIRGARIRGELNLSGISATIGLRLDGCFLEQPLVLCDAALPWLELDTCVLPGARASRARIPVVRIRSSEITGTSPGGSLQFGGAQLGSELRLDGTRITTTGGPALSAAGLRVGSGTAGGGVFLDGLHASGRAGAGGLLHLAGAQIIGSVWLRGAWLANSTGPALLADGITVHGDLRLTGNPLVGTEFTAAGSAGEGTVLARGATISGLVSLEGARVKSLGGDAAGPGQRAEDPAAAGREQGDSVQPAVRRHRSQGAVCLSGSTIHGDLVLRRAVLAGGTLPALMAEGLTVHGQAAACDTGREGFRATGSGPSGAVCLASAHIAGQLALRGTTLVNPTGPALLADLISVGETAQLDQDFIAEGAGGAGAVRMAGATVGGDLSLAGARLTNHTGPALHADRVAVQGDLLMSRGRPGRPFTATGSGGPGTVLLRGAAVGGQLSLAEADVQQGRTPADEKVGDQLRSALGHRRPVPLSAVAGLLPGFAGPAAPGPGPAAVSLSGATVGGPLTLHGAVLCSDRGPALLAGHLAVSADVTAGEGGASGLTAIGAGDSGTVCLAAATVGGQLTLRGATLASLTGPALVADAMQVRGGMGLDGPFAAVGTGARGAVSLQGARVGQALSCAGRLVNPQAVPPAAGREPALNLTRAAVGTLRLGGQGADGLDVDGGFRLDGLSYAGLPDLGDPDLLYPRPPRAGWRRRRASRRDPQRHRDKVAVWLSWLRHSVPGYQAQPYAALAAAYGAAGHDDLARAILVARRDDLRRRGTLSPARRLAQYLSRRLIGYGYHCWYALGWLLALLAGAALVAVCWFGPARYIQRSPAAGPAAAARPAECPVPGRIGYAVGLAVPFVNAGHTPAGQCDVPARGANGWVLAFGWLVRAAAIALLAVYGVGLSGLTRRQPGG